MPDTYEAQEELELLKPGDLVAERYEVVSVLGSGGMGVVYKAKQIFLGTTVAVKMLRGEHDSTQMIARFHREAKAASKLQHPNLVTVTDFGVTQERQPFMVMNFAPGKALSTLIGQFGSFPVRVSLGMFLQACDGMIYVHSNGILHRDLKPSNLIVDEFTTNHPRVLIVDFGVAKLNDSADSGQLTRTGLIFGSPLYMSPEQSEGRSIDQRSDIYSFGCVMFETLTGVPPLQGSTTIETLYMQSRTKPGRMCDAAKGKQFPAEMEEIVARCLEKEPDKRFQSFEELSSALKRFRAGSYEREKKLDKRVLIGAGAAAVAAVGAVVTWLVCTSFHPGLHEAPAVAMSQQTSAKTAINPERDIDDAMLSVSITPSSVIHDQLQTGGGVIRLDNSIATDDDLKALRGHDVHFVSLHHTNIRDGCCETLKTLPLRDLDITQTRMTGRGLNELWHVRTLQSLDATDCRKLHSDALNDVESAHELRHLSLADTKVGSEILEKLSKVRTLTYLDLSNTTIDDGGELARLGKLDNLETLKLEDLPINARCLIEFSRLPKLKSLDLSHGPADDNAMANLRSASLTELDISRSPYLTNASMKSIAQMKSLRKLIVASSFGITSDGIDFVKKELPDCDVITAKEETLRKSYEDSPVLDRKKPLDMGLDVTR